MKGILTAFVIVALLGPTTVKGAGKVDDSLPRLVPGPKLAALPPAETRQLAGCDDVEPCSDLNALVVRRGRKLFLLSMASPYEEKLLAASDLFAHREMLAALNVGKRLCVLMNDTRATGRARTPVLYVAAGNRTIPLPAPPDQKDAKGVWYDVWIPGVDPKAGLMLIEFCGPGRRKGNFPVRCYVNLDTGAVTHTLSRGWPPKGASYVPSAPGGAGAAFVRGGLVRVTAHGKAHSVRIRRGKGKHFKRIRAAGKFCCLYCQNKPGYSDCTVWMGPLDASGPMRRICPHLRVLSAGLGSRTYGEFQMWPSARQKHMDVLFATGRCVVAPWSSPSSWPVTVLFYSYDTHQAWDVVQAAGPMPAPPKELASRLRDKLYVTLTASFGSPAEPKFALIDMTVRRTDTKRVYANIPRWRLIPTQTWQRKVLVTASGGAFLVDLPGGVPLPHHLGTVAVVAQSGRPGEAHDRAGGRLNVSLVRYQLTEEP